MTTTHTVLFDLDGTLIDSCDLIVDSYHHTFRTHGLPMATREEILAGMGTPLKVVFGKMGPDAATMEQWIATYREYNLAHHDTRITIYPGIVAMMDRLREARIRLGLVTSKNHAGARRGLTLVGLNDHMEVVIGADDVTHPKPHAEPVEKALAALGASPAGALFVGDSHHDIASGRAAGVGTVGICWGPFDREHLERATPDHCLHTPQELLDLVLGARA